MARILVVDDNDALRSLIVDFLRFQGHECAEATNVAQARKHLAEKRFDLAVSDLEMPSESGLDLLRYIMVRSPSTCFIMMSGSFDRNLKRKAMRMGARDFLAKPFRLNDLLRLVQLLFPRCPSRLN